MKIKKSQSENVSRAIDIMGHKPRNPIGKCFESSIVQFILASDADKFPDRKLCHGIGIANMPGQEGRLVAHAWIELRGQAYDSTWGRFLPAEQYRQELQLQYVVEYSPAEAEFLGKGSNPAGPWDKKILEIGAQAESLYEPMAEGDVD